MKKILEKLFWMLVRLFLTVVSGCCRLCVIVFSTLASWIEELIKSIQKK